MNVAPTHLTREELLKAVVDAAGLPAERRGHLGRCQTCGQALQAIETELARIGHRARASAPGPVRPFRLPDPAARPFIRRRAPMWAMLTAAVMVLAVVMWGPYWWGSQGTRPSPSMAVSEDGRFLEAVDALVANALPDAYQGIASLAMHIRPFALDMDVDDDLLDWIVPAIDDDSFT